MFSETTRPFNLHHEMKMYYFENEQLNFTPEKYIFDYEKCKGSTKFQVLVYLGIQIQLLLLT